MILQEKEDNFLKDVATHQINILRDDGSYRHLKFRREETINYSFEIITWPGYLCCCGDMGTYVFTRTFDMFEFFRNQREGLYINIDYWSEKCVAMDRHQQIKKYCPELFRKRITEWMDKRDVDQETRQAVEDEVLSCVDEGEHAAMTAAMDFEHKGFNFSDFWEVNVREYDYAYIWCLYAIAWAIKYYDRVKTDNKK